MDDGRKADLAELDRRIRAAQTTVERAKLEKVKDKIKAEVADKRITAERARMIEATRQGDGQAAEQIAKALMRSTGQQAE